MVEKLGWTFKTENQIRCFSDVDIKKDGRMSWMENRLKSSVVK